MHNVSFLPQPWNEILFYFSFIEIGLLQLITLMRVKARCVWDWQLKTCVQTSFLLMFEVIHEKNPQENSKPRNVWNKSLRWKNER